MPDDVTPPADPGTLLTPAAVTPAAGDPTTPPPVPQVTPADDWKAGLPEIFRSTPALKPFGEFKTQDEMLAALATSYASTKAMVGKKLEAPGDNATPDQVAAWRKVTGAPEKPEDYGSLRPEAIPEDLWDKEGEGKFAALAHKHHLPPAAVKEIAALHGEMLQAGLQGAEADQTAMLASEGAKLKAAWGTQFDANLSAAQRFAETIGLEPTNPIFTSSDVVQALARAASLISEDKLVTGQAKGLAGTAERINDIMDPKSTSMLSRQYRGEFGSEQQMQAQSTLLKLQQAAAA